MKSSINLLIFAIFFLQRNRLDIFLKYCEHLPKGGI